MAQLEVTLDSATPGLADALRQLEGEARQLILKDWGEYLLGPHASGLQGA
jgi:aromatic ring-cleaving dioxygenase